MHEEPKALDQVVSRDRRGCLCEPCWFCSVLFHGCNVAGLMMFRAPSRHVGEKMLMIPTTTPIAPMEHACGKGGGRRNDLREGD